MSLAASLHIIDRRPLDLLEAVSVTGITQGMEKLVTCQRLMTRREQGKKDEET